jgi:hypothetical protein
MSCIEIEHRLESGYKTVEDLLNANVISTYHVEDIFNRHEAFTGKFAKLIEAIDDSSHSSTWLNYLSKQLDDALCLKEVSASKVPFRGACGNRFFKADLHCINRVGENGPIERFHIIFSEIYTPVIEGVPQDLDVLEAALRWSFRSWWEIYHTNRRIVSRKDVQDIKNYTERAEQELSQRAYTPEKLVNCFNDETVQAQLEKNMEKYKNKYRNMKDGSIDIAFAEVDPDKLQRCVQELRPDVLWFVKHAASRFAEMIAERIEKED